MLNMIEAVSAFLIRESLIALLVFTAVFIISKLFKKADNSWHLLLWSMVLLRFALPLYLPQSLSFLSIWDTLITAEHSVTDTNGVLVKGAETVWNSEHFVNEEIATSIKGYLAIGLVCCWTVSLLLIGTVWFKRLNRYHKIMKSGMRLSKGMNLVCKWKSLLKIRRNTVVLSSDEWETPFTIGVLKPVIFVPESITGEKELLEAVIAHEMAHIKRFDALWNTLQNLIQIVWYFNPVVWYTARRINHYREMVCDDLVLRSGGIDTESYGKGLLRFAEKGGKDTGFAVLSFASHPLKLRIRNICRKKRLSRFMAMTLNVSTLLIAITFLPIGATQFDSKEPVGKAGNISCSDFGFVWPAKGRLSMKFGKCEHPVSGKMFTHRGVDIAAPTGTEIKAGRNGKVVKVVSEVVKGSKGARGKYIVLEHSNGYQTCYSHLSKTLVKKGETVSRGQKIAEMGSTGFSTGPHLHFEIRKDGRYMDPLSLLK